MWGTHYKDTIINMSTKHFFFFFKDLRANYIFALSQLKSLNTANLLNSSGNSELCSIFLHKTIDYNKLYIKIIYTYKTLKMYI